MRQTEHSGPFMGLATKPDPASPPVAGEPAPGFTLPDQTDTEVTLSEALSTGPVLLVFYRGYW